LRGSLGRFDRRAVERDGWNIMPQGALEFVSATVAERPAWQEAYLTGVQLD